MEDLLIYSLGYYRHGWEKDAVFNVSPLGALKICFYFLVDFERCSKFDTKVFAFGTSESQRITLARFSAPYIGFKNNLAPSISAKFWAVVHMLLAFVPILKLFFIYSDKTNNIPAKYGIKSKVALFCKIITGLTVSTKLSRSHNLNRIYIATDHCPLILSLVYDLQNTSKLEIVYMPHGGSIGPENRYRSETRNLFTKVIPLSDFQHDLFVAWAKYLNLRVNVRKSPTKIINSKSKGCTQMALAEPNCLVWLNQADLCGENVNKTAQFIETIKDLESLKSGVFISKLPVQQTFKKMFKNSMEFRSFVEFSNACDVKAIFKHCPSVVISSSVITRLLSYSSRTYCATSSPLINDLVAKKILQKKGFSICEPHRNAWLIEQKKSSTVESLIYYFREDL